MKVTLFDYGVGNLHSLAKALERGGAQVRIGSDPETALGGDALVLPGVGAFTPAATALSPLTPRLRGALAEGLPCLGICLGMQLLFQASEEGAGGGLGIMPGRVRRLEARRVPHMGWNAVEAIPSGSAAEPTGGGAPDPLFAGLETGGGPGLVAYYANSFVAEPSEAGSVIAWTEYGGERFPAAVRRGRSWGVQFHPEKSGEAGLRLIGNFLKEAAR